MPKPTADRRRAELAKIHIAKKQLGMDDEQYQAVLWTVARVDSAKDLDAQGRRDVLDHLKSRGFKSTPRKRVAEHPGTPHNMDEQLGKIEAQLASMRLPWSYADRIARRMFGIERVAWVRQSKQRSDIIAALAYEQEKRDLLDLIDEQLQQLGLDRSTVDAWVAPKLKGRWHRHLRALRGISEHLTARVAAAEEAAERQYQRERAQRRF